MFNEVPILLIGTFNIVWNNNEHRTKGSIMENGPIIELKLKDDEKTDVSEVTSAKGKPIRRWIKPTLHGLGFVTLLVVGYAIRCLLTDRTV